MPVQRSPIRTRGFSFANKQILKEVVNISNIIDILDDIIPILPLNSIRVISNMAANIYLSLIPKYDVNPNDFIIKCEHIYAKMITEDDRNLFLAMMHFTGVLLQTISNLNPLTWEAIKASLNKTIEKPQNIRDLFLELS